METAALEAMRAQTNQLETDIAAAAERLREGEEIARQADACRARSARTGCRFAARSGGTDRSPVPLPLRANGSHRITEEAGRIDARLAERDLRFARGD